MNMLFVPREKARATYKKLLDERNERRKKEREKYFRELYGSPK